MKKSFFLPLSICGLCLLSACGGGDSGSSSPPAPATHFSVTGPTAPTAGTAFTVTVTALDASNDTVTTYSGTVRFTSTDVQATLPANSALTNGIGTFSTTLRTAGSQTITATDTVTASIAGASPSIDVNSGPPTHFAVSAPTTAQSGIAFDLTVTALDAENNVAKNYTSAMHFSSSDAQATLPVNSTLTDGTGTFSTKLRTAGVQSITATDLVTASITGTSSSITVAAIGPPVHFSVSAPTTAQSGIALNFTVTALDAANGVATGYGGTVHFTSTDGQAALPANSTLTNGAKNFSATLQTVGSQTINATDLVTASIAGTSSSITVGATAPPIHFSVSAPTTAQSGTAFNFMVTALDTANNVATGYSGTVQFTSPDGQAGLPANSTLTNGVESFSATLQTAGVQDITATDTVTASIAGTSPAIDVSPGPPTHFSVSAPSSVRVGTAFSFTVTARDAANNFTDSYAGTVHFTSSETQAALPADSTLTDGTGTFSARLPTTGSQSIAATDTVTASITGTSNSIEVFVNCEIKGGQCYPGNACCPGLRCELLGNRAFCE